MSRKALVSGALLLAAASAGGYWAMKNAPKTARDRLSSDPLPASAMAMDLESLVPKGAVVIAGVRNIPALMGSFNASNFSKVYSGYVARATARAVKTYQAPYLNDPASRSEKSALEILFEKSLVIAIYPPESAVLPVRFAPASAPQMDMPHSVGPKVPPALLLFRIPADITLESLTNHFPLFGHSPSGKGLRSRQRHMNVPVFDAAMGLLAAVIPTADGPVLALGSDLSTLQSCIALALGADKTESASRTEWVRDAFKRVPSDSFFYSLTRDDALKSLNLALKSLPSFTDWSVTSFSWDKGLASVGFNHLSTEAGNPFKDWAVSGPADYAILRLIPPGSLLVVATNSLPPESAAVLLRESIDKVKDMPPDLAAAAKKFAAALSGQLDEQAVLSYNGFQGAGGGSAHDAVLVLQMRSHLRARVLLWQAARELAKAGNGPTVPMPVSPSASNQRTALSINSFSPCATAGSSRRRAWKAWKPCSGPLRGTARKAADRSRKTSP